VRDAPGGFAVNAQLREAHIGREANVHTAGNNPGIVHAGGAATLKGRAPGAAPIGSCASIRRKLGKPANFDTLLNWMGVGSGRAIALARCRFLNRDDRLQCD